MPSQVDDGSEAPENAENLEITRTDVQSILREALSIRIPRGVMDLREVEIGGIRQWISVRGHDRRNPILLFIHGGPGVTEMPVGWFYQDPLEDFFTIVHWDQRGSGKTATSNDQAAVIPTMTFERMVADTIELSALLRNEYGKEKLVVLGHSWGSLLGLELAKRRPDWLHAYVGMGQVISARENEAIGYQFALDEARRRDAATAIRELEAIAPYPPQDGPASVADTIVQRRWVTAFGGMTWGRTNLDHEFGLRLLSPDYSDVDLSTDAEVLGVVQQLLPQIGDVDYRSTTTLDLPVFLFCGRHDYAVPSEVALRWFEQLDAPTKRIVWFEHSAHLMHLEQPGRFLHHLVQDVRPIAAEVGDAAPDDAPGFGRQP